MTITLNRWHLFIFLALLGLVMAIVISGLSVSTPTISNSKQSESAPPPAPNVAPPAAWENYKADAPSARGWRDREKSTPQRCWQDQDFTSIKRIVCEDQYGMVYPKSAFTQ